MQAWQTVAPVQNWQLLMQLVQALLVASKYRVEGQLGVQVSPLNSGLQIRQLLPPEQSRQLAEQGVQVTVGADPAELKYPTSHSMHLSLPATEQALQAGSQSMQVEAFR